jgi:myo-inositol-1(or 4)-monophosphatase
VREAGGFVTDLEGREDMIKTGGILVANEDIHRQMLRALKDARQNLSVARRSSA